MSTAIINKDNVFGIFAKILWLLDENPEIKISYDATEENDHKPKYTPRTTRSEYPKKFVKSEWSEPRSFGNRSSFADRPKHTRWWSKFDWPTDDRAPKKTTNYKTSKFASKKSNDEKSSFNKKWNVGKWYKKAGY